MDCKYLIVLFKNKERYKIIKKYRTYKNAYQFFLKKTKESEQVIFDIKTENGKFVDYEIALIEKGKTDVSTFRTDDLGRNVKLELDDSEFKILKIENYKIPEKIYDIKKKTKIDSEELIKKKFKSDSLKLVSKLNNKIILQVDDNFNLYSLKSDLDCGRFLDCLQTHLINENNKNCLIVKDSSREQKKYLYEILSNLGYDKKMLYRKTTTHLKDK